jgi:hypothetical protein
VVPVPLTTTPSPEPAGPEVALPRTKPSVPAPEPEAAPALPRERVVEQPPAKFPPAAALRRARVALDLLSGQAPSGAKVEVGIDILRSVRNHEEVRTAVVKAYKKARSESPSRVPVDLALALAAVEAPGATAALLESYAESKGAATERLRAALASRDPEDLRSHADVLARLPKTRRSALGL